MYHILAALVAIIIALAADNPNMLGKWMAEVHISYIETMTEDK